MKPEARILLVDDSPATLEILERHLHAGGFAVSTADGARGALGLLARETFDLVVTDLRMPDGDGMDVVRHVRENLPDTEVMMITGYATIQGAVDAVKTGAAEYLAKPFTREELLAAVARALERLSASRRARSAARGDRFGLVGECEGMARAFAALELLVGSESRGLILGEPGTGRGTAARALAARDRPAGPVAEISVLAFEGLTPLLAALQRAEDGTAVLRDVTWAPHAQQEALLRALSRRGRRAVRVLAIAEPELPTLVAQGAFHRQLYAALGEVQVLLPPLRERGEDIVRLAEFFAARLPAAAGRPAGAAFGASARAALLAYPWPGNVPELRGVVARASLHAAGWPLERRDLPPGLLETEREAGRTLAQVEVEHIRRVLAGVGGNKTRAAEILGINRKTLAEKLRAAPGAAEAGSAPRKRGPGRPRRPTRARPR
ncbi:MAG TPA: response regulator [Candidatus Saccharimonadales bacterium]|nr:response regulator [Candidatus Saccharimonadales bacterium]